MFLKAWCFFCFVFPFLFFKNNLRGLGWISRDLGQVSTILSNINLNKLFILLSFQFWVWLEWGVGVEWWLNYNLQTTVTLLLSKPVPPVLNVHLYPWVPSYRMGKSFFVALTGTLTVRQAVLCCRWKENVLFFFLNMKYR